jgi:SulP family sulfate permease
MDAALDFATASTFERAVSEHLTAHPQTRHVMLVAHPINWIDATGVEAFGRLHAQLRERGMNLHVVGIKLPVENVLKTAGQLQPGPHLRLYRTEAEALQAAVDLDAAANVEQKAVSAPAH